MARLIYSDYLNRSKVIHGRRKNIEVEICTMMLSEGEVLYVSGLLGSSADTDEMSDIYEMPDGHYLVTFRQDVLVRVEGLSQNLMTCRHLRYARPNRPIELRTKSRRTLHNRITVWPRLLAAVLQDNNKPRGESVLKRKLQPQHSPGGIHHLCAYQGELILAMTKSGEQYDDPGEEIDSAFMVPTGAIQALLAELKPRREEDNHQKSYGELTGLPSSSSQERRTTTRRSSTTRVEPAHFERVDDHRTD